MVVVEWYGESTATRSIIHLSFLNAGNRKTW